MKVLGALLDAGKPMSGREVARRARMPASTAAQALRELVGVGVVVRVRTAGKTRYGLNPQHHLFQAVRALFRAEAALPDALAEFLAERLRRAGMDVRSLALSFTERGEVLALLAGKPALGREDVHEQIVNRYGLDFCGFVSDPAAGSERFGVWQEFSDDYSGGRSTDGSAVCGEPVQFPDHGERVSRGELSRPSSRDRHRT